MADITPKMTSIERIIFNQISSCIDSFLSPFLSGFRQGFNTQHCLIVMIERWRKALDNNCEVGAILTDLSKAFDCINHELLIAILNVYGFEHDSLRYIYSYLSERKERTEINNSISSWSSIKSRVPQGSILVPLLFNIYFNDIFLFIEECDMTNYADDNTPYAMELNIEALIVTLDVNTSTLVKWFDDNYLEMNADKCHLLRCNHSDELSVIIDNEIILGSKEVKLLGVTIDNKLDFGKHAAKLCIRSA